MGLAAMMLVAGIGWCILVRRILAVIAGGDALFKRRTFQVLEGMKQT
jgi:hypothetical protein